MKKYQVVCLAITDKFGNMHRNQEITYDKNRKPQIKDVILSEELFDPSQLKNYLDQGAVKLVETKKKVNEPLKATTGRNKPKQ